MKHVFLIGYRGTGKSTIGVLLAEQLGLPFEDTDELIERTAGQTIREIFAAQGESGFRQLEQQIVESYASSNEPKVVSLGGGAVLRAENRAVIRSGYCVWLQGSPEMLYQRISQDATSADRRPRLSDRSGIEEIVEQLSLREPLYAELAQFSIMTDRLRPEEIVAEISNWIKTSGHGH